MFGLGLDSQHPAICQCLSVFHIQIHIYQGHHHNRKPRCVNRHGVFASHGNTWMANGLILCPFISIDWLWANYSSPGETPPIPKKILGLMTNPFHHKFLGQSVITFEDCSGDGEE